MNFQDPLLSIDQAQINRYLSFMTSMGLKVRLPAVVLNYNRQKNIVRVQIALKVCDAENNYTSIPPIEMRVHRIGGGNFHISYDLKEGDTGDVVFYDRDMQNFWDSLRESEPETTRSHSLEDCEFYPLDRQSKETGTKGFLITNSDNSLKINLLDDKIKLTNNSSEIEIDSNEISLKSKVNVSSGLNVSGGASCDTLDVSGSCSAQTMSVGNGASGTFTDTGTGATGRTLTFVSGILTQIT